MDGQLAWPLDPCEGGWALVHQGHPIAGIARIPLRERCGKDKASRGLRDDPGLAPKLGRTVAFALQERRNGPVVGIDDLALTQWLALRELLRLSADSVMGLERCLEVVFHTLALPRRQMGCVLERVLRGLGQGGNGASQLQELLFGLAHQADEDFAVAPALAATAAHELLERVVERVGLRLQCGRLRGTVGRDELDEVEDFFCAL